MPLKDGIYMIASTLSTNPVLDIEGAGNPFNSPLVGIVGFTKQTTDNKHQQWIVTTLRPGVYSICSVVSRVWITAPVDGSVDQVDTSVYDPVQNVPTRWKITSVNSNSYQIESVQFPGRVIDLEFGSSEDNTRAILYPNHKSDNQIWQFIPIAI
ncbi:ricin B lectin domain-containing protein [Trichoderma barbatum]